MSRHNTIRATLAISVAAFTIGTASAGAMPIRDGSPPAKAPQGPHAAKFYDAGHASLAIAHAKTQASAQDVLAAQGVGSGADLRSPDARDAAIHSGTATQPVVHQGPPQFSTTKVAALHSTQPVNDDGDDVPLLGFILGLAGAGLVGVGAAFAVSKTTRTRRARVVA